MFDRVLERELSGYEGDKKMTKLAVSTTQYRMKELLKGEMGEDIKAVLNGERSVDVSYYKKKKFQILSWAKRLLKRF